MATAIAPQVMMGVDDPTVRIDHIFDHLIEPSGGSTFRAVHHRVSPVLHPFLAKEDRFPQFVRMNGPSPEVAQND